MLKTEDLKTAYILNLKIQNMLSCAGTPLVALKLFSIKHLSVSHLGRPCLLRLRVIAATSSEQYTSFKLHLQ